MIILLGYLPGHSNSAGEASVPSVRAVLQNFLKRIFLAMLLGVTVELYESGLPPG